MEARGAIPIHGNGMQCENLLDAWLTTMTRHDVLINEQEECKAVKRATDGDYFTIETAKRRAEGAAHLHRASRSAGARARGAPMKLRAPGEELKLQTQWPPRG
jgi:hypothetical protein